MKKAILTLLICVAAFSSVNAQKKWDELTDDQKIEKLKAFRADNQKYLKNELGMTPTQLEDIDNVNICYLATLDRIDRYSKDEAKKDEYAQAVTAARSAQLDAIMGADKHKKFAEYVQAKLDKAQKKK
jgi:hypothetical protein